VLDTPPAIKKAEEDKNKSLERLQEIVE